jgi:hypothetical protein
LIHQPLLLGEEDPEEEDHDLVVESINLAEDVNVQTEGDSPSISDDGHHTPITQSSEGQSDTVEISLDHDSNEEEHGVLVVDAIDPGITIATELNPQVRWSGANLEDQRYVQQLERRLVALENRSASYLTGELSAEQLHSLDDSLQLKLARMMHPMIDMLTRDIQEYMDKEESIIDNRLLTAERASLSRMEEQVKTAVLLHGQHLDESITNFQRQRLEGLTMDMHDALVKAEQLASTKLYSLQHEIVKDIAKLDSRIGEIESNNVKDLTLNNNQLQSIANRLNNMTEDMRLTKEEQLLQSDKAISRYLDMNDIFRMTLEAHVNERFDGMKEEMRTMVIKEKNTNLDDHLAQLVKANERMQSQFQDMSSKMLPMISDLRL